MKPNRTPSLCSYLEHAQGSLSHRLQPAPSASLPVLPLAGRQWSSFSAGDLSGGDRQGEGVLTSQVLTISPYTGCCEWQEPSWTPWRRGRRALAQRSSLWTSSSWCAASAWIVTGAPRFCLACIPSVRGEGCGYYEG